MAKNYSIKSFGGWSSVEGKVFLDGELALVGSIVSVQKLDAHADAPFLHSHKEHEYSIRQSLFPALWRTA